MIPAHTPRATPPLITTAEDIKAEDAVREDVFGRRESELEPSMEALVRDLTGTADRAVIIDPSPSEPTDREGSSVTYASKRPEMANTGGKGLGGLC